MPNLLVAGNSTNGGTAITTDTSGTLNIVTGSGSGSNAITIDASQAVTIPNTLAVTSNQTVGGNLTVTGSITGGSISVANSLRAWVNFNGTGTVAIRASFNVTSITDNGAGDYTVNFTNALTDANYAPIISASSISQGTYGLFTNIVGVTGRSTTPTTSAIRVFVGYTTGTFDESYVCVSIFR